MPAEVYDEVITNGQQAGYADAGTIAEIIGPCTVELVDLPPELSLMGLGEAAALSLFLNRLGRGRIDNDVIVSDDQQFLRFLERRQERKRVVLRYLDTPQFIADSAINGLMPKHLALDDLARLWNKIPERQYTYAIQRLEIL